MEVSLCQHYKTEYCKFKERCKKHHESEACFNMECDINNCTLRHPKICKYFALQKFCNKCAYKHDKDQQNSDTVKKNINILETQFEVKQLRCEMIKLKLENKHMAEKICEIEEIKEDHEIEYLKWEIEKLKKEN